MIHSFYKNNNIVFNQSSSKLMKMYNNSTYIWWLRTAEYNNQNHFNTINYNIISQSSGNYNCGVSPAFRIG